MPHLPAYTVSPPLYILYPIEPILILWGAKSLFFTAIPLSGRRSQLFKGSVSSLFAIVPPLFTITSYLRVPASPLQKFTKKIFGGGISSLRIDAGPLEIEWAL
jgi:hypothetical protein